MGLIPAHNTLILIADSGSTKTDWRLISEDQTITPFQTQGISPFFQTAAEIKDILKKELTDKNPGMNPSSIYYYGTGCKHPDKKRIIQEALKYHFPEADIEVESDMLGAARALCGRQPGIAAILGTGSNTCYYDGSIIIENRTSGGFILGDEGSGAHIGKTFVQHFLNDELPTEIATRFSERLKFTKDDIIDAVYRKPLPNRFLASFSKFVFQNIKEPFMIQLVSSCFDQFFEKQVCKYKQSDSVALSCSGSVAFYYNAILKDVAVKKGIQIGSIVESPIAALTLYHLEEQ